MSGCAKKRRSGSGARSGGVVERERSGERTKLTAQISLKGDTLLNLALNRTTHYFDLPQYCLNWTIFGELSLKKNH